MSRLFRPSTVVFASAVLAFLAVALLVWPLPGRVLEGRALVRSVPPGDQEVVWLNAATNAVSWERFVAGVHRLATDRPELQLEVVAGSDPFPGETAAVPELAVRARGSRARLWFRWYKLTGDLGPRQWVPAFAGRNPAPLAVIGGGSTDRARDLALELTAHTGAFRTPPVLLITSATAVRAGGDFPSLTAIYAGRTFRFCFTNLQMAEAVADFIWSQEDLRPDVEPFYMTHWGDDPYSEDLFEQFHTVLGPEGFSQRLDGPRAARKLALRWAWAAGRAALGGGPPAADLAGFLPGATEPARPSPFWSTGIPYSIGTFAEANPSEAEAAERILAGLEQHPGQQRPLLVLPGWPQPARRFLRALLRSSPRGARRFVVATGDAIDFNTVYRDRDLTWPIQDLPLSLVFFCHRNPVDPAAFEPEEGPAPPDPAGRTATGTQELLLYRDIAEAVIGAAFTADGLLADAGALRDRLRALRGPDGGSRFDAGGDLRSGAGEFVVCLRPVFEGDRVLPRARLQVWNRRTEGGGGRSWARVPVAGKPELAVVYSPGG